MDDARRLKSLRTMVCFGLLLQGSSLSFGAGLEERLSERDDSSEGLQSYAVSGKGRVARSQEGWSLRRIAKAIGTAALYASGQALSGTQQAMGEFSGQSGSGVAPFLVGTTVLTLPSYVGGQPMNLGGDQGILHPSTYGEDQATPVSPAPALRGTVPPTTPAVFTIDEEGELECSLDGIPHSSTDGSLSLLEVGVITEEDRKRLGTILQSNLASADTKKDLIEWVCSGNPSERKNFLSKIPIGQVLSYSYNYGAGGGSSGGGTFIINEEHKKFIGNVLAQIPKRRRTTQSAASAQKGTIAGGVDAAVEKELLDVWGEEGVRSSASASKSRATFRNLNEKILPRVRDGVEEPGMVNYVPTANFQYLEEQVVIDLDPAIKEAMRDKYAGDKNIANAYFTLVAKKHGAAEVAWMRKLGNDQGLFVPTYPLGCAGEYFISSWKHRVYGCTYGLCVADARHCQISTFYQGQTIESRFGERGLYGRYIDTVLTSGYYTKADLKRYNVHEICLNGDAVLSLSKGGYEGGMGDNYHSEQGIYSHVNRELDLCLNPAVPNRGYFYNSFREKLSTAGDCPDLTEPLVLNIHILTQRSPCVLCSSTWLAATRSTDRGLTRGITNCFKQAWVGSACSPGAGAAAPAVSFKLLASFESNELHDANEHISFAKWNDFFAGAAAADPIMHLTRQLTAEEDALTKDLAYLLNFPGMRYVFRPGRPDLGVIEPFDDLYRFNCPQLPAAPVVVAAAQVVQPGGAPAAGAPPQPVAQEGDE
ncbi:MAG: hypothetical protein Q8Q56_02210 [Alphaproteobacteria bacterium]|nr:hypothetical protein [Alphaproteobacteria bacterium]